MTITIFTNLLSGHTGLDKSSIMTANHLHRRGYVVSVINLIGPADGTRFLQPQWPLDEGITVAALQTLAADGGRWLHKNMLATVRDRIQNLDYAFTESGFRALRQLNLGLGDGDAIIFTHPLQAWAFDRAIEQDDRRCRTILQIHGDYSVLYPELTRLMVGALDVIDDVQVVSSGLSHQVSAHFPSDRIHWIPNIHDPAPVVRTPRGTITIAHVGSFQDTRNQLDAVRMMERLGDLDVELHLWGNSANKYGNYVRTYTQRSAVSDRVVFAGIGSEQDIYGSADIVVMPSRSEGFGYPLVEAAAHGVPVVAYDYDFGPRDVIDDGVSGYIVREGDVDALASGVRELAESPNSRETMGAAARAVFDRSFAPDRIVDRYDKLLAPYAGGDRVVPSGFCTEGADPVDQRSIQVRSLAIKGRNVAHVVRFRSDRTLRRFRIESNARTRTVRAVRTGRRSYRVLVLASDPGRRIHRARQRVVSFETDDPRLGRFYLGNTTTRRQFEIGRHLLRSPEVALPACFTEHGAVDPDAPDYIAQATFAVRDGMLEFGRDPRWPVTGGRDSFGVAANTPGGVSVRNGNDVRAPSVQVSGEFDTIEFWDAEKSRRFAPPYGYRELFERVLDAERSAGLFEYAVLDGIHPWELYRAAFIAHVSEGLGLWGKQFGGSLPTWDVYLGPKSLAAARGFDRVLFEFPRKADGPDPRTLAFQTPDTMIIEYPQPYGYGTGVYTDANRFAIQEFNAWRSAHGCHLEQVCDTRMFDGVLSRALGFPVHLGTKLDERIKKYRDEREFWSRTFARMKLEEVVIPSSHWSAGVCDAARGAGAVPADIQYALTSRFHPSYWFGRQPRHGATRFYAWTPFWADRANGYEEIAVAARGGFDRSALQERAAAAPEYDVTVISQPRVSRRILDFTTELATARPGLRICIAPHPDERSVIQTKLIERGLIDRVDIANTSTLETIARSVVCVGGYSTSMYEAAYLGKSTYVLPVPGHEIVADDTERGLFKMVTSVDELEPFELPSWRTEIF